MDQSRITVAKLVAHRSEVLRVSNTFHKLIHMIVAEVEVGLVGDRARQRAQYVSADGCFSSSKISFLVTMSGSGVPYQACHTAAHAVQACSCASTRSSNTRARARRHPRR